MKRILLLFVALSVLALGALEFLAIPSSNWEVTMQDASVGLGAFSLLLFMAVRRERMVLKAAMLAAALFFALINPAVLYFGTLLWLSAVVLASVFLAAALEPTEGWTSWRFFRSSLAGFIGYSSTTACVLYMYEPFEDVSIRYVIAILATFYVLAFIAAPWDEDDPMPQHRSA